MLEHAILLNCILSNMIFHKLHLRRLRLPADHSSRWQPSNHRDQTGKKKNFKKKKKNIFLSSKPGDFD